MRMLCTPIFDTFKKRFQDFICVVLSKYIFSFSPLDPKQKLISLLSDGPTKLDHDFHDLVVKYS